jgi:TonB family protein
MKTASLLCGLFLSAIVTAAQTSEPQVVTPDKATSHLLQRVEPTVPPIAKVVKIGGKVKVHISISPSGEVSSATMVSGSPMLMSAAIAAVKQWKFKPFLENANPIAVSTDVELDFPAGMSENESTAREKYYRVADECRSLVKGGKYTEAEPECREAVEISDSLPKDVVLERSEALSLLANSIFLQRRYSEAIPFYERALELDKGYVRPDDADLASDYENLGRAYSEIGNLKKADELYALVVTTFTAAIKDLPSMSENYSRRLRRALNEYDDLKDAEGQSEAATALRQQAGAIISNPEHTPD